MFQDNWKYKNVKSDITIKRVFEMKLKNEELWVGDI